MILLALLAVTTWSLSFIFPNDAIRCVSFGMLLICLAMAVIFTLGFVLSAGKINVDHNFGAICAYVIVAMIFANIYYFQWRSSPAAFRGMDTDNNAPWSELFYFGFPINCGIRRHCPSDPVFSFSLHARRLTATFYIAVLITRLTGMYAPLHKASSTVGEDS